MYKFIFVLLVVVGMATASNAQEKQNMKQSNNKPLVAYFSVTGTTARAAEKLARVTGGELYAITPVESYTNADLDWNDKRSRSSVEMNDPKSRPAIQEAKKNIADYDVIFIGYPIWWILLHVLSIRSLKLITWQVRLLFLSLHRVEAALPTVSAH